MANDTSMHERLRMMVEAMAQQGFSAVTTAPGAPVIPANEKRLALIISPPASGNYTVSMNTAVVTGGGMLLFSTSSPLSLNIWDHGHMVRETFHIAHSVGGVNIAWWELIGR